MITTALAVSSDGAISLGNGPTFGILLAILFVHGVVCSAATSILARLNIFYVLVNGMQYDTSEHLITNLIVVGTTVGVIIALYVCSGDNKVSTRDAFTKFENNTGWANSMSILTLR